MKNNANGPADCLVTEMLQCLPTETVYEVACWFEKRFKGERRGNFFVMCFLRTRTLDSGKGRVASAPSHLSVCFTSGAQQFWWTCCARRSIR